MRVVVSESAHAAGDAAAEAVADGLIAAVDDRGQASIALSGGTTPAGMVSRLASLSLPWDRVHIFQVDERVVPLDDPARNWLSLLPLVRRVPVTHRHPMPVETVDGDRVYATELSDVTGSPPVLDDVHLGLGADGHTASLVPGDQSVDIVDRDVCWTGEYQGHRRLTLSLPVLGAARQQTWLVTGSEKALAVQELIQRRSDSPAARVAAKGSPTLFLDADAAALAGLG